MQVSSLITALAEHIGRISEPPAAFGNLWGSSYVLVLAAVLKLRPRPCLLLTATDPEAEEAVEDLSTLAPHLAPVLYSADNHQRMELAARIAARSDAAPILVASVKSLSLPLPALQTMASSTISLRVGANLSQDALAERLVSCGFERLALVEAPGQFSVRGGLMDIYPWTRDAPVRIDCHGNTVESLRAFDPDTQGSLESADSLDLNLSSMDAAPATATLSNYLSPSWLVAIRSPAARLETFDQIVFNTMPEGHSFKTLSLQRFSGTLQGIPQELKILTERAESTVVFCGTPGEEDRLKEILRDAGASTDRLTFVRGVLSHGFIFEDIRTAFVPHHELFNRYRLRRPSAGRAGPARTGPAHARRVWQDLERGDIVVHQDHGIGRFVGIERVAKQGFSQEFLIIEYDGGARLYTPAANADRVQKYLGATDSPPPLHRLGGKAWDSSKERAWEAVVELAEDMVRIQALRELKMGVAYPSDTDWEHEFEASFPYEETPDQDEAIRAIREDMASPKPMDRLLCGDVGYGKTELAMRAAFKAAIHHKQTAVLVPTTLLAQQHYQTFRERMADYPIAIEVLSRFRSRAEQQQTLDRLASGKTDIVIGTHRLLQPDVIFKDLGLIVIDEEQRFGVEHKERLKKLRATVDILTMTATPIPRTLHMSLLGIKDISSLATPPRERLAIRTEIVPFDRNRIRPAIMAELERAGQVFFVHNRVVDIDKIADGVRKIVPEATVGVAHGQMNEDELEETMLLFLEKEIDVLVATTIIESGLDIPNANTILINNADQFGLADLHQLRGRVGRYKHQAYCCLLIPQDRPIQPHAQKRLKAIEEFSELGSGFKIAMRDLEIRGVGNLLGREQHGHIAAIGYELYCKMLERAAKQMKSAGGGRPKDEDLPAVTIDLPVTAFIPEAYLPDLKSRLEIYRKLGRCGTPAELEEVRREMADRFGAAPAEVENLMEMHHVRILAARWKIVSLAMGENAIVAKYLSPADARKLQKRIPDRVRIVDDETLHIVTTGDSRPLFNTLKSALQF